MNFLRGSNFHTAALEQQLVNETEVVTNYVSKSATTLEGLIAEDPLLESPSSDTQSTQKAEIDEVEADNIHNASSSGHSNSQADSHIDVAEDEGLIIIPYKEVPDDWSEAPDILSFRSLDRNFVFPGEQIQILACLSAYKQDVEIITPFKVAAVMNKNGIRHIPTTAKQNGNGDRGHPDYLTADTSSVGEDNQNGRIDVKGRIDSQKDAITGASLLRMEDHKRQTVELLQRFKSSHFFVRIAESNEPLWSIRKAQKACLESSVAFEEISAGDSLETALTVKKKNSISAAIDRGRFDAHTSGGLARGAVKCCSLSNGDIVVFLQVNIGIEFVKDPFLEILQFEKYQEKNSTPENKDSPTFLNEDPSCELLKWLLPLDNSTPPPSRPLSPPTLTPSSSIKTTSSKPTVSGSSQIFSFGNFRSYSMSSLPPNTSQPPVMSTAKPVIEQEDWDQFSFKKFVEDGNKPLLSFRGVPLQQERFSVRCGLEGIFTPGRRWRRKLELIQPVEIHSFSVDCNTDDLLCVHVKNVSPAHAPDIVVYIDAITLVFEEASKGGPPLFLPIACIESGNDYSLPNLALRRGEEHSFILKPATTLWKHLKGHSHNESNLQSSRLPARDTASSRQCSFSSEGKRSGSPADQYAVFVTCRCNYTESKLFFKHSTSWRPCISRDIMISVASEASRQTLGSNGTQLPVQVLTLRASNMTSDNLTLTVLAPASFTLPPSVVSLHNSPSSPLSPFYVSANKAETVNGGSRGATVHGLSSVSLNEGQKVEDGPLPASINERPVAISDLVPNGDLCCSHLWLQSRVPLGCVPSQSTATIKLEVLPLTDGIITLDSLQIDVKERGLTYVPEHSLKINATSSIATGNLTRSFPS